MGDVADQEDVVGELIYSVAFALPALWGIMRSLLRSTPESSGPFMKAYHEVTIQKIVYTYEETTRLQLDLAR